MTGFISPSSTYEIVLFFLAKTIPLFALGAAIGFVLRFMILITSEIESRRAKKNILLPGRVTRIFTSILSFFGGLFLGGRLSFDLFGLGFIVFSGFQLFEALTGWSLLYSILGFNFRTNIPKK